MLLIIFKHNHEHRISICLSYHLFVYLFFYPTFVQGEGYDKHVNWGYYATQPADLGKGHVHH